MGGRILIGVTGSVATIKLQQLVDAIRACSRDVELKIVATDYALSFIPEGFPEEILTDKSEWTMWSKRGDPILHIELRKWADVFLIAPLDANTLAKISNGICDNLVTSIIRAWNFDKPVIVCPAMNTAMWNNPFTESHLNTLRNLLGIHVIDPQEKALMCGDIGMGAMADVQAVATYLASFL